MVSGVCSKCGAYEVVVRRGEPMVCRGCSGDENRLNGAGASVGKVRQCVNCSSSTSVTLDGHPFCAGCISAGVTLESVKAWRASEAPHPGKPSLAEDAFDQVSATIDRLARKAFIGGIILGLVSAVAVAGVVVFWFRVLSR